MKGKYRITVENKRLRYEFEIKRNITVIRGDSATGKTTLVEMLMSYQRAGADSGVTVNSDCPVVVASEDDWKFRIQSNPGSIIFVDECNHFPVTEEFASEAQKADNYFVLILRDDLPNLPYSVSEIYGIRTSDKYAGLKKVYHEFYNLYGDRDVYKTAEKPTVVTEDSNSGFEFFSELYGDNVISAEGKSNILSAVKTSNGKPLLIIADGAAFGSEMEAVMRYINNKVPVLLYLPESFEWIVLKSGVVDIPAIHDILAQPEKFIDSKEYFSWERFFTALLISGTKNSYLKYQKKKLNEAYLSGRVFEKICEVLPDEIRTMTNFEIAKRIYKENLELI